MDRREPATRSEHPDLLRPGLRPIRPGACSINASRRPSPGRRGVPRSVRGGWRRRGAGATDATTPVRSVPPSGPRTARPPGIAHIDRPHWQRRARRPLPGAPPAAFVTSSRTHPRRSPPRLPGSEPGTPSTQATQTPPCRWSHTLCDGRQANEKRESNVAVCLGHLADQHGERHVQRAVDLAGLDDALSAMISTIIVSWLPRRMGSVGLTRPCAALLSGRCRGLAGRSC